jgi:hypothetical protein
MTGVSVFWEQGQLDFPSEPWNNSGFEPSRCEKTHERATLLARIRQRVDMAVTCDAVAA